MPHYQQDKLPHHAAQAPPDRASDPVRASGLPPAPLPFVDAEQLNDPQQIAQAGAQGQASAMPYQAELEQAFGVPLDGVRAHLGTPEAVWACQQLGALAYACDDALVFSMPDPDRRLCAHEASHFASQALGEAPDGGVGQRGDAFEQRADEHAEQFATDGHIQFSPDHPDTRSLSQAMRGARAPKRAVQLQFDPNASREALTQERVAPVLQPTLSGLDAARAETTALAGWKLGGQAYLTGVLVADIELSDTTTAALGMSLDANLQAGLTSAPPTLADSEVGAAQRATLSDTQGATLSARVPTAGAWSDHRRAAASQLQLARGLDDQHEVSFDERGEQLVAPAASVQSDLNALIRSTSLRHTERQIATDADHFEWLKQTLSGADAASLGAAFLDGVLLSWLCEAIAPNIAPGLVSLSQMSDTDNGGALADRLFAALDQVALDAARPWSAWMTALETALAFEAYLGCMGATQHAVAAIPAAAFDEPLWNMTLADWLASPEVTSSLVDWTTCHEQLLLALDPSAGAPLFNAERSKVQWIHLVAVLEQLERLNPDAATRAAEGICRSVITLTAHEAPGDGVAEADPSSASTGEALAQTRAASAQALLHSDALVNYLCARFPDDFALNVSGSGALDQRALDNQTADGQTLFADEPLVQALVARAERAAFDRIHPVVQAQGSYDVRGLIELFVPTYQGTPARASEIEIIHFDEVQAKATFVRDTIARASADGNTQPPTAQASDVEMAFVYRLGLLQALKAVVDHQEGVSDAARLPGLFGLQHGIKVLLENQGNAALSGAEAFEAPEAESYAARLKELMLRFSGEAVFNEAISRAVDDLLVCDRAISAQHSDVETQIDDIALGLLDLDPDARRALSFQNKALAAAGDDLDAYIKAVQKGSIFDAIARTNARVDGLNDRFEHENTESLKSSIITQTSLHMHSTRSRIVDDFQTAWAGPSQLLIQGLRDLDAAAQDPDTSWADVTLAGVSAGASLANARSAHQLARLTAATTSVFGAGASAAAVAIPGVALVLAGAAVALQIWSASRKSDHKEAFNARRVEVDALLQRVYRQHISAPVRSINAAVDASSAKLAQGKYAFSLSLPGGANAQIEWEGLPDEKWRLDALEDQLLYDGAAMPELSVYENDHRAFVSETLTSVKEIYATLDDE